MSLWTQIYYTQSVLITLTPLLLLYLLPSPYQRYNFLVRLVTIWRERPMSSDESSVSTGCRVVLMTLDVGWKSCSYPSFLRSFLWPSRWFTWKRSWGKWIKHRTQFKDILADIHHMTWRARFSTNHTDLCEEFTHVTGSYWILCKHVIHLFKQWASSVRVSDGKFSCD